MAKKTTAVAKAAGETEDTKALAKIEPSLALTLLKGEGADERRKEFMSGLDKRIATFPVSAETAADRKMLKSSAAALSSLKERFEEVRKGETESMRNEIAAINEAGKEIADGIIERRVTLRKPLTDWEESEEERKKEKQDQIEAIKVLGKIPFGASSADIQTRIDALPTHDLAWYQEFSDEAAVVIEDVFNGLVAAKAVAKSHEDDLAKAEAQKEELRVLQEAARDRERKDFAARQILAIKAAGNLIINGSVHPVANVLSYLERDVIITETLFGDAFSEAIEAKDEAIAAVREKYDAEKQRQADEAEANRKALADAEETRQRLADAEKRALDAEAALAATNPIVETVDPSPAPQASAGGRFTLYADPIQNSPIEVEASAGEATPETEEVDMVKIHADLVEDIRAAIVDTVTRREAYHSVADALINGRIRHVSVSTVA